jgi:hypothetical protein
MEMKKIKTYIALGLAVTFIIWSFIIIINKTNSKTTESEIIIIHEEENPKLKKLTNIIKEIQPKLDPAVCNMIANTVIKYSTKYQLPPEFIICIIEQESHFKLFSISSANCKGLMQINPAAHPEKLKKLKIESGNIFHIDNNIHLGCMILREYYNKTKDIEKALVRYVGGNNQKYVNAILSRFATIIIEDKEINVIAEKKTKINVEPEIKINTES